ncbi:ADP-ribosylation factor-like protein [Prevotella nigrescens]
MWNPLLFSPIIAIIVTILKKWPEIFKPNKKTKNIAILGCKESGKTTLWSKLGAKLQDSSEKRTGQQNISEFTISKNNKTVSIAKTKDIGGGDKWVFAYQELIHENTFIYYLIDGREFEAKSNFGKITRQIEKIKRLVKEKENCGLKLLITHRDETNVNKQDLKLKIKEKLGNKIFELILKKQQVKLSTFLENNVDYVNLLDENDINKIKDEIIEAL